MYEKQEAEMGVRTKTWSYGKPLISFFILAFALSWIWMVPLALKSQGLIKVDIPYSIHYLAAFGPMLAALIVTWISDGKDGLKDLFSRITKWRVRPLWWLVAVAPLWLYGFMAIVLWLIQGRSPDISLVGQIDFLPNLGFGALVLWVFTFGFGEEIGWRGYALPRLQRDHNALTATFILWIFWAFWHLPMFFYSYQLSILPGFLIGLFAGAIILTWLYNSSEGSILMVALWHGTFNFATACITCKTGIVAAAISTSVMVWALVVVLLFKPATLSRSGKQDVGTFITVSDINGQASQI